MDFPTCLEFDDTTSIAVGDIMGWLDDGASNNFTGLTGAPSFEGGTVARAGESRLSDLVTHDASCHGYSTSVDVAFESHYVGYAVAWFAVWCRNGNGNGLDLGGVINAACFELSCDVVGAPFSVAVAK